MASGARGRLLHPTIYLVASASRGTQDGRGQGRNRRPHAERSRRRAPNGWGFQGAARPLTGEARPEGTMTTN